MDIILDSKEEGKIPSREDLEAFNRYEFKDPEPEKSGFFDLPISKICRHPQHYPPMHLHIPLGKGYRHKCPACGHITTIVPPQIFP